MPPEPPSRERVLAYLLGELPPAELAQIDRRLLEDEAFGDLLEEARNELLDAYTLGTLPEAEHVRARRALSLPAEDRGGEADFARALRRGLRQQSETSLSAQPPTVGSGKQDWRRRPLWAGALAACGVSALGLWLVFRGAIPGLAGLRAHPPVASPLAMAGVGQPGERFVLLLRPAVLRGPSPQQTVRLPAGLAPLETQIVVPDAGGRYEVRVQSAAGEVAYPDLEPRSIGGVRFVQVAIARDRLPAGTCRFLLLEAEAGAGSPRLVHRYTVRVIAP